MTVEATGFANDCRWIWLNARDDIENQYVCFRREFGLRARPAAARLMVSADSDYQVFVNGHEVYGRQFSDYPHHRSYDTYPIASLLRRGRNVVAILAYYRGRGASEYRRGHPGLIVQIDAGRACIVSDRRWRARLSPAYASGGSVDQATVQMGFTVRHDARREDGWTRPDYRPGRGWRAATELAGPTDGYWRTLEPRRLPQMVRAAFQPGSVVCAGALIRPDPVPSASPSLAVATEFKRAARVPPSKQSPWVLEPAVKPANGAYLLADMGAESFGLLRVELEAPAGAVVDVAHGEHLEDLGVRAAPGYRRFTDRFVCRAGRNVLTVPFRRLGCRYIELHVTAFRRAVRVHAVGLEPLEYPVREAGSFASADRLLDRLQQVSIRTLKLCMGDHYFDCPWREQSLYSYDSRNQALYGYYVFGEYEYPRQSYRLLGWGEREGGLLDMCAPSNVKTTIPVFSLAWIAALREHWLFSGSPALFEEFRPTVERVLRAFLARPDKATGVYRTFEDSWLFYEWTTGLDYQPRTGPGSGFRLDAPHNLYLVEAMRAHASMLALAGETDGAAAWERRAGALARAVHNLFWDAARGRYATYADRRRKWHYAAGVQALALCAGVAPAGARAQLQEAILHDRALVDMTLQVMGYGVQAMRGAPASVQAAMLDRIRGVYGGMIENAATSLWEVADTSMVGPGLANDLGQGRGRERRPYGGDDMFAEAGSLCHGWSAVPIWMNMAYVLGVRPLTPGFATFAVEPHAAGLPGAEGAVPTPRGPVAVRWEMARGTMWLDIRHPRGTVPSVVAAPGFRGRLRVSRRAF